MKKLSLILFLLVISVVSKAQTDPIKHFSKRSTINYKDWGHSKVLGKDSSILTKSDIDNLRNLRNGQSKVISKTLSNGSFLTINSINRDNKISYGGSISSMKGDSAVEISSTNGKDFILTKKSKNSTRFVKSE